MREAIHVVTEEVERIPYDLSKDGILNLKKLAKKGTFQCPYCEAMLEVRAGEERGVYFAHRHSEACIMSEAVGTAEKKYEKQLRRETESHKAILDIILDELKMKAKLNDKIEIDFGYRRKHELKYFPDIWIGYEDKEFAISVVSNVMPSQDSTLAKDVVKRHEHFTENGMIPVWFIENKEFSIEKDKHAIILWDAEYTISSKTTEDLHWEDLLSTIITDLSFFDLYNYRPSMQEVVVDVRSTYYVQTTDDGIMINVNRFVSDHNKKPYRAFLINQGYNIPFSEALVMNKHLQLSEPAVEEQNRVVFKQKYEKLKNDYDVNQERIRVELEELKKKEEEAKQKERERRKAAAPMIPSVFFSELRKRFRMGGRQQQELWRKYILLKGWKNFKLMLEIVDRQGIDNFDDFKHELDKLGRQPKV